MINASYNCTQQQAYNTCRFAWRACQQNLLSFANYKSNYNVAFVAENLDAIDAADALDRLSSLVGKSLVEPLESDGTFSYRLFGVTRGGARAMPWPQS